HEAKVAQFLLQPLQNLDPTFSEAAQQEHALLSDGIDDIANLLIVQQEIDELRDLNVVDGDGGFVLRCDDQVLLLRLLQFWTPRGYAVEATAGEISTRQVGFYHRGRLEARLAEVRSAEVRLAEVSPAEVRLAEVRPAEASLAEVRLAEVRSAEVRPHEFWLIALSAEVHPAEVRPAEFRPAEVRASNFRL